MNEIDRIKADIANQDNRCTSHPMYLVQEFRDPSQVVR